MVTRCIERSVCDDASVWPVLPPMSFAALRSCSDRRERESLPGHLVAGVFYAGLAAAASPARLPSLSSAVPVDGRGMTGDPPIANSVNSTAIDGCHNNPFAGLAGRLLAAAGAHAAKIALIIRFKRLLRPPSGDCSPVGSKTVHEKHCARSDLGD